jgi:acetolactate synthase-1/2/3 large subunit
MRSLKFKTDNVADGILLISGAGDGDTGGGLCAFEDDNIRIIDRVSTAGITFFDGRLARLLRTRVSAGGGEILIYDSRGVLHYFRIDELSDAHYMAWDGQHLVICSTGNNSLFWITLGGEVARRWRPDSGDDDSWHLNDICLVGEQMYVCAFGKYLHYREYKDHLDKGDGFVFEFASGRPVVTGLHAPHSPRYFDGAWTICDSQFDSVVQVDAAGNRKREARLRSFTRGLAVTDDYIIAGESVRRRTNGDDMGSIAILRRSDFSVVARYEVPFREVSDIVLAPRSFLEGVKAGFRTNPLRVSESNQLQMFRDIGIEPQRLWSISERLKADQCKIHVEAKIPANFVCGKLERVECTVQNLSEAFLFSEPPYPVNLSYRWRNTLDPASDASGDGIRTQLPGMLSPASTLACQMEVLAPGTEGDFEIVITLVQDGVAWFDTFDRANACSARVRVVCAKPSGALTRNGATRQC